MELPPTGRNQRGEGMATRTNQLGEQMSMEALSAGIVGATLVCGRLPESLPLVQEWRRFFFTATGFGGTLGR